ncbi:MAG: thiopeptide-type bacteriocin biosynthesis protein, partial [Bacteroidota bacterium]
MSVKRIFVPGDEWIYYQFSCGPNASDTLLVECIEGLADSLLKLNLIDKWFFVRYDDPHFHLRVRFRAVNSDFTYRIYQVLNVEVDTFVKKKIIWKVSIDTYQREIERYGEDTIELVEDLFFYESKLVCRILNILYANNMEIEEGRWQACVYLLGKLIENCFEDINGRIEQTSFMFQTFLLEFDGDSELIKKLDEKYRFNKTKIVYALSGNFFDVKQVEQHLFQYIAAIRRIIDSNPAAMRKIGGSLMHMLCNRFFHSDTRLKELVVYSFLSKKFNTDRFLNKT